MGLLDILGQYMSGGSTQNPAASQHYAEVVKQASPEVVSHGLADAFRDDQTPPFGQMVGQLFGNSNPQQRAGLLNQLLGAMGSGAMGGGGLLTTLRQLGGGGPITSEQASTVTPDQVAQATHQAAQTNPGIIDRISEFYAQHPTLVQTLGTAALSVALSKMASRS